MLAHTLSWPYEHLVVIGCKKTLDFKLILHICEIDLFTYPTLTKSPAEIILARLWQWQQVKTVSYVTREHTGTIKVKSPAGCNENAQFWFGPTDYSQQCDTRSGLRAGKIKGVVTVYNKTIKSSCFILSYHIVIKDVWNSLTKARSHNVYSLSLKLPVRCVYYNWCVT